LSQDAATAQIDAFPVEKHHGTMLGFGRSENPISYSF